MYPVMVSEEGGRTPTFPRSRGGRSPREGVVFRGRVVGDVGQIDRVDMENLY